MARQFNGIDQALTATIDLAAATVVSVAFWLWWDAFAGDDAHIGIEFVNTGQPGGFTLFPNSGYDPLSAGGSILVAQVDTSGSNFRFGGLTWPSAAAWHHYQIVYNLGGNVLTSYIDGVLATLNGASGTSSGTFKATSDLLSVMARNGGSFFGAGRMADLAIWKSGCRARATPRHSPPEPGRIRSAPPQTGTGGSTERRAQSPRPSAESPSRWSGHRRRSRIRRP